jgi:ankyrin repeat protein
MRKGKTALAAAVFNGSEIMIKMLLKYKANVHMKDDAGRIPLSLAAQLDCQPIVLTRLKKKANIDEKDKEGKTPLSRAARRVLGDMFKLRLKNGADVNEKDNEGRTPLFYAVKHGKEAAKQAFYSGKLHIRISTYMSGWLTPRQS